jgi:nicotinate-nucleotide adenylyltransferase
VPNGGAISKLLPMNLGILGGTFDPPHNGHLALAHAARAQFSLTRVLFIPAGDPYHRRSGSGFQLASVRPDLSPASARLAMIRLAIAGEPSFEVDDRELRRHGPTYTVDTLEELHAERPQDALHLLLGADSAAEFARWRSPERIAELATIAVAPRSGVMPVAVGVPHVTIEMEAVAVTSTAIRARVAATEPIDGLVPVGVAAYIRGHGLYRAG